MNSFTEKKLRATIRLADDSCTVFPGTGSNTLVIDELRMAATVTSTALMASDLNLNIWGMRESDMDALTSAWIDPAAIRNNLVVLEADSGDGYSLVFQGSIIDAQPDFRRAPDVPFQVLAQLPYFYRINVATPLSYSGTVSIDVVCKDLASKMGLSYLNVGAEGTVTDAYYAGTLFDQLRDACEAARVNFYLQADTLVIAPLFIPLNSRPAVVLSPSTGLIGYPMYNRRGLVVSAIYQPAFQCASAIEIQDSHVKGANGRWNPYSIEMTLSSNLPGGQWVAVMQCNREDV
jgi:hypothetical protein